MAEKLCQLKKRGSSGGNLYAIEVNVSYTRSGNRFTSSRGNTYELPNVNQSISVDGLVNFTYLGSGSGRISIADTSNYDYFLYSTNNGANYTRYGITSTINLPTGHFDSDHTYDFILINSAKLLE